MHSRRNKHKCTCSRSRQPTALWPLRQHAHRFAHRTCDSCDFEIFSYSNYWHTSVSLFRVPRASAFTMYTDIHLASMRTSRPDCWLEGGVLLFLDRVVFREWLKGMRTGISTMQTTSAATWTTTVAWILWINPDKSGSNGECGTTDWVWRYQHDRQRASSGFSIIYIPYILHFKCGVWDTGNSLTCRAKIDSDKTLYQIAYNHTNAIIPNGANANQNNVHCFAQSECEWKDLYEITENGSESPHISVVNSYSRNVQHKKGILRKYTDSRQQ